MVDNEAQKGEEKRDLKPAQVPTRAPTEEEMAQKSGVPSAPENYPLFKKLDALTEQAKRIADTLDKIVPLLGNTPKGAPAPKTTAAPAAEEESKLDDVRNSFPEDLEMLLNFEDTGDSIKIKPKQFLGSENFAKIASTVRGLGGEYISAGKDSHFKVAYEKA